jgi:hypothetical protein
MMVISVWRTGALVCGVGLFACAALAAVPKAPVSWTGKLVPAKAVKPGAKVEVQLTGVLDAGWHLYALEEPEGGPIATVVALTEGDAAELEQVTESKPKMAPDPAFGQTDGYFTESAGFVLHARVAPDASGGEHPLHVMVKYQSCNDKVCLPPRTDVVVVPLTVGR